MTTSYPRTIEKIRRCVCLGVLASFTAVVPIASAADLYRWTDSNGTVHFTDKPPKGVNAEKIKSKRRAQPQAEEEQKPQTDAQKHDPERCKIERERLEALTSSREIRMRDADGGIRVLTPDEIQQEIDYSKLAIARYCRP